MAARGGGGGGGRERLTLHSDAETCSLLSPWQGCAAGIVPTVQWKGRGCAQKGLGGVSGHYTETWSSGVNTVTLSPPGDLSGTGVRTLNHKGLCFIHYDISWSGRELAISICVIKMQISILHQAVLIQHT